MEDVAMPAKEAIIKVCSDLNIPSKYRLAQLLSDETLKVQPIQIYNYLVKDRKMSKKVADRFTSVFGIVITDVHERGSLTKAELERLQ